MFICCCLGHNHYLIHLYATCLCESLCWSEADDSWYEKRTAPCGLLHKDPTCLSIWQGEFARNRKQVVNWLKPTRVSPHYCFIGGVKFSKGDGSVVIYHNKNDLLHKDTTYIYVCVTYSLRKGEFTLNQKQVVNRLKIPQGLSTLLFRRWSEVP